MGATLGMDVRHGVVGMHVKVHRRLPASKSLLGTAVQTFYGQQR